MIKVDMWYSSELKNEEEKSLEIEVPLISKSHMWYLLKVTSILVAPQTHNRLAPGRPQTTPTCVQLPGNGTAAAGSVRLHFLFSCVFYLPGVDIYFLRTQTKRFKNSRKLSSNHRQKHILTSKYFCLHMFFPLNEYQSMAKYSNQIW